MLPRILIPACSKSIGGHASQTVQDKYVDCVARGAGGLPLLLPCPWVDAAEGLEQILDAVDGVFLTGSPSNIEPHHYGGPSYEGTLYDPRRDAVTLPLARTAVDRGIPVLGVCRGFQEMNVALGGSLHQRVHEAGFNDHRAGAGEGSDNIDRQYGPAHKISVMPGGVLARILGKTETRVNSLHGQGVDRLAPRCTIEATADDGLVEAFSVDGATAFALAVQWHPEWRWEANPDSARIFAAFGDAVRDYAGAHR